MAPEVANVISHIAAHVNLLIRIGDFVDDGHRAHSTHANRLENFWSLPKRSIRGTYVSVEPFHVFRYPDEQAYRFNNRKLTDRERFRIAVSGIVDKMMGLRATAQKRATA